MGLIRYATGRRHAILGQSNFQYRLQKYMWKYRKCNSHIPLPRMKKPRALTVTSREIVAETAQRENTHLYLLNYIASFSSEMQMELTGIKNRT